MNRSRQPCSVWIANEVQCCHGNNIESLAHDKIREAADNVLRPKCPFRYPNFSELGANYLNSVMYNLRIRRAKQVVLVCNNNEWFLTRESMGRLAIVEEGQDGGVSVVVNNAGRIECIDLDSKIDQKYQNCNFVEEIDASGMCIVPGELEVFSKGW